MIRREQNKDLKIKVKNKNSLSKKIREKVIRREKIKNENKKDDIVNFNYWNFFCSYKYFWRNSKS